MTPLWLLQVDLLFESTLKVPLQCTMVKTRVDGECTYDENGFKRRAACVVFKDEKEDQVIMR